jgi:hypothetical protein
VDFPEPPQSEVRRARLRPGLVGQDAEGAGGVSSGIIRFLCRGGCDTSYPYIRKNAGTVVAEGDV